MLAFVSYILSVIVILSVGMVTPIVMTYLKYRASMKKSEAKVLKQYLKLKQTELTSQNAKKKTSHKVMLLRCQPLSDVVSKNIINKEFRVAIGLLFY